MWGLLVHLFVFFLYLPVLAAGHYPMTCIGCGLVGVFEGAPDTDFGHYCSEAVQSGLSFCLHEQSYRLLGCLLVAGRTSVVGPVGPRVRCLDGISARCGWTLFL